MLCIQLYKFDFQQNSVCCSKTLTWISSSLMIFERHKWLDLIDCWRKLILTYRLEWLLCLNLIYGTISPPHSRSPKYLLEKKYIYVKSHGKTVLNFSTVSMQIFKYYFCVEITDNKLVRFLFWIAAEKHEILIVV